MINQAIGEQDNRDLNHNSRVAKNHNDLNDTVSSVSGYAVDLERAQSMASALDGINPAAEGGFDNDGISTITMSSTKPRKVRLIYCGDGVIEECEEDEQERIEREKAELKKKAEEQARLDQEAVSYCS